jgi:hypothetical protein
MCDVYRKIHTEASSMIVVKFRRCECEMSQHFACCKVEDRKPSEMEASNSSNSSILWPDMLAVFHSREMESATHQPRQFSNNRLTASFD